MFALHLVEPRDVESQMHTVLAVLLFALLFITDLSGSDL